MTNSYELSASLSNLETEAVTHFSLVMCALSRPGRRFGPLKVYRALDSEDGRSKRVRICTTVEGNQIEGIIVLKFEDYRWVLYQAASDINFGDGHAAVSYDLRTNTYTVRAYYLSGSVMVMDINMSASTRGRKIR